MSPNSAKTRSLTASTAGRGASSLVPEPTKPPNARSRPPSSVRTAATSIGGASVSWGSEATVVANASQSQGSTSASGASVQLVSSIFTPVETNPSIEVATSTPSAVNGTPQVGSSALVNSDRAAQDVFKQRKLKLHMAEAACGYTSTSSSASSRAQGTKKRKQDDSDTGDGTSQPESPHDSPRAPNQLVSASSFNTSVIQSAPPSPAPPPRKKTKRHAFVLPSPPPASHVPLIHTALVPPTRPPLTLQVTPSFFSTPTPASSSDRNHRKALRCILALLATPESILMRDYLLAELLGYGSNGCVLAGFERSNGDGSAPNTEVAIKLIYQPTGTGTSHGDGGEEEVRIMEALLKPIAGGLSGMSHRHTSCFRTISQDAPVLPQPYQHPNLVHLRRTWMEPTARVVVMDRVRTGEWGVGVAGGKPEVYEFRVRKGVGEEKQASQWKEFGDESIDVDGEPELPLSSPKGAIPDPDTTTMRLSATSCNTGTLFDLVEARFAARPSPCPPATRKKSSGSSGPGNLPATATPPLAISEREIGIMFAQAVEAVREMHGRGLAHGDLKEENFLVTPDLTVKLADFGHSHFVFPPSSSSNARPRSESSSSRDRQKPLKLPYEVYGTLELAAPGLPQDIWALGLVLYTLWHGELPEGHGGWLEGSKEIGTGRGRKRWYGCEMGKCVPTDCRELLRKMLAMDPAERATIDEVAEHGWTKKWATALR
ncbi:hypothetical protein HDU93_005018 [Gonapodya sp. JEL0774]|nr:hypothetical protein HDU93_005018 [Gonapodya sp. JEL0774]